MKKVCAVIDTNVLVAALLTKNCQSATVLVMQFIFDGTIVPLYHEDILDEYNEVLHRTKFHFREETIALFIQTIREKGIEINPKPTGEVLIDMDDLIFYEVAMEKQPDNAWLVTGNLKHYPERSFIVTPAEMVQIIVTM